MTDNDAVANIYCLEIISVVAVKVGGGGFITGTIHHVPRDQDLVDFFDKDRLSKYDLTYPVVCFPGYVPGDVLLDLYWNHMLDENQRTILTVNKEDGDDANQPVL
jgi:hypothetical protein